jgi:Flp pilus assembly protein CpaB
MRRGRIFFYLAVLIILVIIVILIFGQNFLPKFGQAQGPKATPTAIDTVDVVVVQGHISRGQKIDPAALGTVKYPRSMFIDSMVTDINKVKDKLAKIDLERGFVLVNTMYVDSPEQLAGTGSNASLMVPKGMVAISIPITRLSAVSYAIQRGDHVNVIATMAFVDLDVDWQTVLPNRTMGVTAPGTSTSSLSGGTTAKAGSEGQSQLESSGQTSLSVTSSSIVAVPGGGGAVMGRIFDDPTLKSQLYLYPSEAQRPRLMSQTVLQNITVLNVGNFELAVDTTTTAPVSQQTSAQQQTNAQTQAQTEQPVAPLPPDVITLIVSPQHAIALNYLVYSGAQLTLVLRSANDDTTEPTDAVTMEYLLKNYDIPVPLKLPYGAQPRVDEVVSPKLPNDNIKPTPAP